MDKEVASLSLLPIGEGGRHVRMQWSPDGSFLAVPTATGITVLARPSSSSQEEEWKVKTTLQNSKPEQRVQAMAVAWGPSGSHLVASYADKSIWLWEVETKEMLERRVGQDVVTDVVWGGANSVVLVSQNGCFAVWDNLLDDRDVVKASEMQSATPTHPPPPCFFFLVAAHISLVQSEVATYNQKKTGLSKLIDNEAEEDGGDEGEEGSMEDDEAGGYDGKSDLDGFFLFLYSLMTYIPF